MDDSDSVLGVHMAIARARSTLMTVQTALNAVLNPGDLHVRVAGIEQIVVFGRAITNVLQNIRGHNREGFDEWYGPWQEEMKADPLCLFFYKARSVLLKEGKLDYGMRTVRLKNGVPLETPGPPVIVHTFTEPEPPVAVWILFIHPPEEHLGRNIRGQPVEAICRMYVEYLQRMVSDAANHFDSPLKGRGPLL